MNSTSRTFGIFLAAALFAVLSGQAAAEDIDLYQTNPGSGSLPNVLFLIDNTANWNASVGSDVRCDHDKLTKRCLEHIALSQLFSATFVDSNGATQTNKFQDKTRVGFMVFSDGKSPSGGKNRQGGAVVEAVKDLTDTYRQHLHDRFAAGISDPSAGLPKSNNAGYALGMYESYQYFRGDPPWAGGLTTATIQPDGDAFTSDTGTEYLSPAESASGSSCNNYLVIIGNGSPDIGENSGGTPEDKLAAIGGNTDTITGLDPDDFESIVADEYSRFFNSTDVIPNSVQQGKQTLRTYVIDVHDSSETQRKDLAGQALLHSIANQTGADAYYVVSDPNQLQTALTNILNKLAPVNSVFAAAALPVSVNVRGTNLNQVYIGVFRPDANQLTRWYGNLKLYQLGADPDTGNVFLADVNGAPAQDSETGFIRDGATSFWTHASTYWDFSPRGDPASGSDAPDGAVVEKGGVAQRLRELPGSGDYTSRRAAVYTCTTGCTSGSSLSTTPFSPGNADIDAAALNVSSESDADALIDWVRGEDNHFTTDSTGASVAEDEDDDGQTNDARASVHGDVLHSQPAIVNYGTADNEDIVIFYGANDGMIHAVTGGTDSQTGGTPLWSFVPPEFFGKLNDLREDSSGKTYFADGNVTAYVKDVDGDHQIEPADGDRVLIFASMRRGGRFLYALDVTDKADPKFLWKISNATPGFAELGQTWSAPSIGRLRGMDDPVAIFGAGYDPAAEDPSGTGDPPTGPDNSGAATQGRGLFVVDAIDGHLIWQAGPSPDSSGGGTTLQATDMIYSTPAAPTAIDRDRDGFLDRVYIPTTGGQVWRVNLVDSTASTGPDPDLWDVQLLAQVGTDQEFQYPVDVVAATPTDIYSDRFDAVLVGSGDRENPFDTAVTNHFYMFKDVATDGADTVNTQAPLSQSDLFDATDNAIQDGSSSEKQAAISTLNSAQGWFITLENEDPSNPGTFIGGEKVVGSSTTVAGTTFFNTNVPSSAVACSAALGEARNYAVNFRNGASTIEQNGQAGLTKGDRYKVTQGGGFPPSPVPVVVPIGGKQYLAVVSGTTVTAVPNLQVGVRQRVYWYNEKLDR